MDDPSNVRSSRTVLKVKRDPALMLVAPAYKAGDNFGFKI